MFPVIRLKKCNNLKIKYSSDCWVKWLLTQFGSMVNSPLLWFAWFFLYGGCLHMKIPNFSIWLKGFEGVSRLYYVLTRTKKCISLVFTLHNENIQAQLSLIFKNTFFLLLLVTKIKHCLLTIYFYSFPHLLVCSSVTVLFTASLSSNLNRRDVNKKPFSMRWLNSNRNVQSLFTFLPPVLALAAAQSTWSRSGFLSGSLQRLNWP